ncbi:hypothetical protein [Sphingomicrobium nitratireducens]|uniref:hypothetical protein n=1 Tax=Sphingomicrobium nitratireducens TaxID=2964666 RepID=UPI00223F606D|nr:hypothetical protein [Sphingomicrobium nitratireducens]
MLKGLLWAGATGVAAIAGFVLYNHEEIARVSHEIAQHGPAISAAFEEEFDRAEDRTRRGEIRAEDAYEQAIERAVSRLERIDVQGENERIRIMVGGDAGIALREVGPAVSGARRKLEQAQEDLRREHESGDLSDEDYEEALEAIAAAETALADMRVVAD